MEQTKSQLLEQLLRSDHGRAFNNVRVVAREHVRFGQQILVPANRTEPVQNLLESESWPHIRIIPLAIHQHTLIATWDEPEAVVGDAPVETGFPEIDWSHFQR